MAKRVLIVAAHPDDEILGCGGTAARHIAQGDSVGALIVAEGATSRAGGDSAATAHLRDAAEAAAKELGAEPPRFLGLPDNRLDTMALLEIVQMVEAILAETRPEVIYTHHSEDLNIDHRLVHQAVLTAARPLPGSFVDAIYGFETPSSTEWAVSGGASGFHPTRFVDVGDCMSAKHAALRAYGVEMREFPHPRSHDGIDALAQVRGMSAGLDRAEAFTVVREIVRR